MWLSCDRQDQCAVRDLSTENMKEEQTSLECKETRLNLATRSGRRGLDWEEFGSRLLQGHFQSTAEVPLGKAATPPKCSEPLLSATSLPYRNARAHRTLIYTPCVTRVISLELIKDPSHRSSIFKRIVQVQCGISCVAAVLSHCRVLADKENMNEHKQTQYHPNTTKPNMCPKLHWCSRWY